MSKIRITESTEKTVQNEKSLRIAINDNTHITNTTGMEKLLMQTLKAQSLSMCTVTN